VVAIIHSTNIYCAGPWGCKREQDISRALVSEIPGTLTAAGSRRGHIKGDKCYYFALSCASCSTLDSLKPPPEVGRIVIPTLQIRKMSHREGR